MMEDLPDYDNFTGPRTVPYPDPNPGYNTGERHCSFDCRWDFLLLDGNSLDFNWMSLPMESLSTNQQSYFATEPSPNQLDMSLIGNLGEPALPVDLENHVFPPLTTLGQNQGCFQAPLPSLFTTQNISASASSSSMSSGFPPIPSTQETSFPVPIPQIPDTSTSPLYVCNICAQSYPNNQRLKRHQKQHLKPVTCTASATCHHRTAENRDMKRHIIVHHPGHISVQQYFCPQIGCEYAKKGFKRLDHLRRHIQRKHRGPGP